MMPATCPQTSLRLAEWLTTFRTEMESRSIGQLKGNMNDCGRVAVPGSTHLARRPPYLRSRVSLRDW